MSGTEGLHVYLVGMMGCGKSTVGRLLAAELGARYVDNDATIAEFAGRSTVDLARAGGGVLHEWESRYAYYLGTESGPLVAGVPASAADRPDELRMLRLTGRLVYLRCDAETLKRRVAADGPRPWLDGPARAPIAFDRRDAALRAACERVVDASASAAHVTALLAAELARPAAS